MKKILCLLSLFAVLSAASCTKEEENVQSGETMTVTLAMSKPIMKATFTDEDGIRWKAGHTIMWDGGSYKIQDSDIDKVNNTITFTAEGLYPGKEIRLNNATYDNYIQSNAGEMNDSRLFLKGKVAAEGQKTMMKIVGSILRFLPYSTEGSTESVKSVTFNSGETTRTVTLDNAMSLEGVSSKEDSKGIYLAMKSGEYATFKVTMRTKEGKEYVFDGTGLTLSENTVTNMSLPLEGHEVEGGDNPEPEPVLRNLYISPGGSDSNNGLSASMAFKTFAKVLETIKPGDAVNIMPGNYQTAAWNSLIELKPEHSGEPGKYITFKAYDPNDKPVFIGKGKGVWNTVKVQASYIIFDGIEMMGDNANINLADAEARSQYHYDNIGGSNLDWGTTAIYNTNAMAIDGESGTNPVTNVIVRNCEIHDFPGCGLGSSNCDYITFENNLIYNNAWFTMYACSGISIMHPVNTDSSTEHKIIIKGNRCFNNKTQVKWYRSDRPDLYQYSDGNGIILDINNRTYTGGPYAGRTLVTNNVSVNNGGSGIHAYSADHVDIINNTAYHNGHMYANGEYADIYGHSCKDVHIINNIMYGRSDGHCNKAGSVSNDIIYENNLCYGGKVFNDASYFKNGKIADPQFVKLSTDIADADFHLKDGSPAIGMGVSKPFMPTVDIEGTPRNASSITVGAYAE